MEKIGKSMGTIVIFICIALIILVLWIGEDNE